MELNVEIFVRDGLPSSFARKCFLDQERKQKKHSYKTFPRNFQNEFKAYENSSNHRNPFKTCANVRLFMNDKIK